jgi:hypothetical protein
MEMSRRTTGGVPYSPVSYSTALLAARVPREVPVPSAVVADAVRRSIVALVRTPRGGVVDGRRSGANGWYVDRLVDSPQGLLAAIGGPIVARLENVKESPLDLLAVSRTHTDRDRRWLAPFYIRCATMNCPTPPACGHARHRVAAFLRLLD